MINLLQDFENYLRSVGLHKNSVRNYLTDLIKFSLWFEVKTGKKLSPSTLESSHINLYLKELQDSNIPASTIKRYFTSLTRFSSWMMPTHNLNYFTDQQTAKSSNKNMEGFEIYLKNKELNKDSIRNYLNDVEKFLLYFKTKTGKEFEPQLLNLNLLKDYKEDLIKNSVPESTSKR